MKVKIDEYGILPTRAHANDAGLDIYSPVNEILRPNSTTMIKTGVHVQLPEGTVGIIKGRSSMNRCGILTDGVIDEGYTGEIGVGLVNTNDSFEYIDKGSRIAQLIILKCERPALEVVDELEKTERGDGGFGSTGA